MPRNRFAQDRGLTTRMVVTMFLIGLLYVVFVGALLALLRGAWPMILIIAGLLFVVQFWFSDRIAAFSMGAHEVTPQEQPELHGVIDRICALADLPKPKVAVARSDVPNAFATGRNQKNTVVCVTTGLLQPAGARGAGRRRRPRAVARRAQGRRRDDDRLLPRHPSPASSPGSACGAASGAAATRAPRRFSSSSRWSARWSTRSASCSPGCCRATASCPPTAAPPC